MFQINIKQNYVHVIAHKPKQDGIHKIR